MKRLVGKRKFLRIQVSKAITTAKCALSYLNSLKEDFQELDTKILESEEELELDKEIERCSEYEKSLIFLIAELKTNLDLLVTKKTTEPQNESLRTLDPNSHCKLKLPINPLPEFSNRDGENFSKFLEVFESSIVNKSNLISYEKYVYLLRQLKGDRLTLIRS